MKVLKKILPKSARKIKKKITLALNCAIIQNQNELEISLSKYFDSL